MLNINTIVTYPLLTILSRGKRTFQNMGRLIKRSGDTIARILSPTSMSLDEAKKICLEMFLKKKTLFCIIDDTIIKKIYSQYMQGAGLFFDTKIGRRIMAYRLMVCAISDGKFIIPIGCEYLFTKELADQMKGEVFSKEDLIRAFIRTVLKLFPQKKIIVLVDGLYTTVKFLQWCCERKIRLEARMHSNRVVTYKGKKVKIKELALRKGITPKGRQMVRTISVVWYGMDLELSIVRRIDKKGNESIVFQIATYKTSPHKHRTHYKKRWPIEKLFRTTKQHLGLQECQSLSLDVQHNHIAAVLLAYSFAQLDMKKRRLKTPEEALRRLETKNAPHLIKLFSPSAQGFHNAIT